jgi:hypothetical protein
MNRRAQKLAKAVCLDRAEARQFRRRVWHVIPAKRRAKLKWSVEAFHRRLARLPDADLAECEAGILPPMELPR